MGAWLATFGAVVAVVVSVVKLINLSVQLRALHTDRLREQARHVTFWYDEPDVGFPDTNKVTVGNSGDHVIFDCEFHIWIGKNAWEERQQQLAERWRERKQQGEQQDPPPMHRPPRPREVWPEISPERRLGSGQEYVRAALIHTLPPHSTRVLHVEEHSDFDAYLSF